MLITDESGAPAEACCLTTCLRVIVLPDKVMNNLITIKPEAFSDFKAQGARRRGSSPRVESLSFFNRDRNEQICLPGAQEPRTRIVLRFVGPATPQ